MLALNKTVLYHQEKLRENEDALSATQSQHAQLQVAFRDLTDKGFTPTPSPMQTPPQSDHGVKMMLLGRLREPLKRGCVFGRQTFSMIVGREIDSLSMEEALHFQNLFVKQAEKSKGMEP